MAALNILDALSAAGRPVAYYPLFAKALGSVTAGVFISQFFYWKGRGARPDGWIYKTAEEITAETGLSQHEQRTVRKLLKQVEVMADKVMGQPGTVHYRFDWGKFDAILTRYVAATGQPEETQPKPQTLHNHMREVFDQQYAVYYPGTPYLWNVDQKQGRDFKHLRLLANSFTAILSERKRVELNRGGDILAEGQAVEVPPEEVLAFWGDLLAHLPPYYVEKELSPFGLYRNLNKILRELITLRKNGNPNTQPHGRPARRGYFPEADNEPG